MRFSERIGAVRRVLQKDSMDQALRNTLWNVVYTGFWKPHAEYSGMRADRISEGRLLQSLWTEHFHQPIDEARESFGGVLDQVRTRYMDGSWVEVYDFIEFVASYPRAAVHSSQFAAECNAALERHVSAYRFVGTTLAPITSEEEIAAVEQAMSHGDKFQPVTAHLETALARLGDRLSPDYRNSIKESISAVEAVCQVITGDASATLGKALKLLRIHPALEQGFSKMYGYTSLLYLKFLVGGDEKGCQFGG